MDVRFSLIFRSKTYGYLSPAFKEPLAASLTAGFVLPGPTVEGASPAVRDAAKGSLKAGDKYP